MNPNSELDAVLIDSVASRDVPFVVAVVADSEGVRWQGCAGLASESKTVELDAVFRIYSRTKAIGAAAAMILIDRGLLSLATPVASVVPEFDRVRYLESIGPGGPWLRMPHGPARLDTSTWPH